MNISHILQKWYRVHHRELPWRNTRNPYNIWLSEIILQQTRVNQGLAYYYKFIEKYPSVEELAHASDNDVMRLWQGLGYYSRAQNLLKTARIVAQTYQGVFPNTAAGLLKLPGIGPYASAAIASFAFDECIPVIDGNVARVMARIFNIQEPIDTSYGQNAVKAAAQEIIDCENPALHNQALMEFGALQCRPGTPDCSSCPLIQKCLGYANNNPTSLPIKIKKTKVAHRYFFYLIIDFEGRWYIRKRTEKDIWQHLHEFILIETPNHINPDELFTTSEWKMFFKNRPLHIIKVSEQYKHVLSHQHIHAHFIHIKIEWPLDASDTLHIEPDDIVNYSISRLTEKYIQDTCPELVF